MHIEFEHELNREWIYDDDEDVTFTAFIYQEDKETVWDMLMDYDERYVVEFAKFHNWDEVVNDITGEVVWKRNGFER